MYTNIFIIYRRVSAWTRWTGQLYQVATAATNRSSVRFTLQRNWVLPWVSSSGAGGGYSGQTILDRGEHIPYWWQTLSWNFGIIYNWQGNALKVRCHGKYGNDLKSRKGFYSAYLPLLGWGMIYLWSCVRQRSFSVRFPPLVRLWSMMAINPEAGTYTYTTTLYCRPDRFRNSMSSTQYNLPASLDNFTFLAQLTNWSTGSNHA